jgi:hypothetical protein
VSDKPIHQGGLMRCCIQSIFDYKGPEYDGVQIGCKFHKDPNEPVAQLRNGCWDWVGERERSK